MPVATRPPVSAPPHPHDPRWIRAGATLAALAVFWLDIHVPLGIALPALYVVPLLLFIWGGLMWEPLFGAMLATVLTAVGMYLSPVEGGSLEVERINRPLEIAVVWMTAGLMSYYRLTVTRWTAESVRTGAEVHESLRRLEEIRYALDQAAIVAATDERGRITYVNDKFCEISNFSREELIGQTTGSSTRASIRRSSSATCGETIARGRSGAARFATARRTGRSTGWTRRSSRSSTRAAGRRQYLAIRSDITARKQAEAQLTAQAALTQLGELAAVVAHEVRNPLAGLRASLEVLRSRLPATQKEREILQAMIHRIDALNAKVNDMLRFARPRTPVLRPVDVGSVAAEAVTSARAAVGAECPEIALSTEAVAVQADPEMLRAVLLNLLLNACQAGGPRVEVIVGMADDRCVISVADRGAGIPEEIRDRIFDAFFTTKTTGTGLGLPIVKRLIELQSGSVRLRPREGGGTVAELTVPLSGAKGSGDPSTAATPGSAGGPGTAPGT
jgi:PAS domain S-box-containing protein